MLRSYVKSVSVSVTSQLNGSHSPKVPLLQSLASSEKFSGHESITTVPFTKLDS